MTEVSFAEPLNHDKKRRIRESLRQLEVMEGVLPTNPSLSPELRSFLTNELRSSAIDPDAMVSGIDSAFASQTAQLGGMPASDLLAGTRAMREQLAAFAGAGIGFFHANEEVMGMSLSERAARGGNTAVTRVFNQGERVLLETQNIVLKFADDIDPGEIRTLVSQQRLVPIEKDQTTGAHIFAVDGRAATDAALELLDHDEIDFAEPDFIEHIGTRQVPSSGQYPQQWHHQVIKSDQAWATTQGQAINVVVIDNGFDTSHPDLANLGPISGWYRPSPGGQLSDFVSGIVGMPNGDHGTACAGMAAGGFVNGAGGLGVAFGAQLHVLACLIDQIGTQSTLARAIGHAFLNGADVITCSLGPSSGATWQIRQVLREAIEAAAQNGRGGKGCPILWATSNGNVPVAADQVCSHPDVIAVGRSTQWDTDHASAFGPQLEFLAPGVNVWIPAMGGGFRAITGTSFAAPAAAGAAALALAENPSLTARRLRELLRATCDKIGNLPYIDQRNGRFGFGRVNALEAVKAAPGWPTP